MCSCPAHRSLVDCNGCHCDHTSDRMLQLGEKNRELDETIAQLTKTLRERDHTLSVITSAQNPSIRWQWLKSTLDLQQYGFEEPLPKHGTDLADYVRTNVTALIAEVGEALKEIGWKPWSTGQGYVNRAAYLGELVDVGHFLANLLVAVGITDDEWEAAYQRKQQVNLERQMRGYDTRTEKCPACGRAYDDDATRCLPASEQIDNDVPYCEDYGRLTITTT